MMNRPPTAQQPSKLGSLTRRQTIAAFALFILASAAAATIPLVDGFVRGLVIGAIVMFCILGGITLGLAMSREGDDANDDMWLPSHSQQQ